MMILAFLGLFLGAKAWEQEFDESMAFHPQLLIDAVHDAKNSFSVDMPMSSNGTCCKCIGNVGCHAVNITMISIQKWCEEHSPKKKDQKRFCKLLERKPAVVEGMVIFWIHPLDLGFAYCLGHGDCKHKPNVTELIGDDMKFGMEHVLHHLNVSNTDGIEKKMTEFHKYHKDDHPKDEKKMQKYLRHQQDHKPCPYCVKAISALVMQHAIKKVVDWCLHTKCPKAKAICKWALQHKAIAFGYLLAAVEPWKFATGYCWPRPYHHHHHNDEEDVDEKKSIYA
eukprot:GEMP01047382.1.p1 GENE.GEMP01047382.1~~GEMP01047382.1.p1  ORF type:complete len:281 (+),score=61.97 GEMP01047382.1:89-931(+)